MCTALLYRDSQTFSVFMNRDERRDRDPEVPPRLIVSSPCRAYPSDGSRGGTWIGINDLGVIAFLLNAYSLEDEPVSTDDQTPSRGQIIPTLLQQDYAKAVAWLDQTFDPQRYPSFTLVIAGLDEARSYTWLADQWSHQLQPLGWQLFSSSSWNQSAVLKWRQAKYQQWLEAGSPFKNDLPAFSLLSDKAAESWSPMMGRELSATRSVTRATVSRLNARCEMDWWPCCHRMIRIEPDISLRFQLQEMGTLHVSSL